MAIKLKKKERKVRRQKVLLLGAAWFLVKSSVCVCVCVCVLVAQSCQTLCNPMDCSPPGSSVHGILQARVLEWIAMPSSRRSFQPRDRTQVSCIVGRLFTF